MSAWEWLLIIAILIIVIIIVAIVVINVRNAQKPPPLPSNTGSNDGGNTGTGTSDPSTTDPSDNGSGDGSIGDTCQSDNDCSGTYSCSKGFCQLAGLVTGQVAAACSNNIAGYGCNTQLTCQNIKTTGIGICSRSQQSLGQSCNSSSFCIPQLVCNNSFNLCNYRLPDPTSCPTNLEGQPCTVPGSKDSICTQGNCKMAAGLSCKINSNCRSGACTQPSTITRWVNDSGWSKVMDPPDATPPVIFYKMLLTSDGSETWALDATQPALYYHSQSTGWLVLSGQFSWVMGFTLYPTDIAISNSNNAYVLYTARSGGVNAIYQLTISNGQINPQPYQTVNSDFPGQAYFNRTRSSTEPGSQIIFATSISAKNINGTDEILIVGYGLCPEGAFYQSVFLRTAGTGNVTFHQIVENVEIYFQPATVLFYTNPNDPNQIEDFAYSSTTNIAATAGCRPKSITESNIISFHGSLENIIIPPNNDLSIDSILSFSFNTINQNLSLAYKYILAGTSDTKILIALAEDVTQQINYVIPYYEDDNPATISFPAGPSFIFSAGAPISLTNVGLYNYAYKTCSS